MQDYTREEFAEILQKTHKMSGDADGGVYKLHEFEIGALEIDLNYKMIHLWSGTGDVDTYALTIPCESHMGIERKLTCFYEMLEVD